MRSLHSPQRSRQGREVAGRQCWLSQSVYAVVQGAWADLGKHNPVTNMIGRAVVLTDALQVCVQPLILVMHTKWNSL